MATPGTHRPRGPLVEVALVFLKLGVIGFGGPAAHVALMRDECVVRRRWLDEHEFVDALGVTSAMPGPGSTQMSMVIGLRRAGWPGLVVGGVCFILPAFVVVLGLAWAYVRYGHTTLGSGLLYGLGPAVIAVLANALWGLSRVAVRGPLPWLLAAGAVGAFFAGIDVLVILALSAVLLTLVRNRHRLGGNLTSVLALPVMGSGWLAAAHRLVRPRTSAVALEFLKLGVVVFGSGYVLFAFLRHDLVSGMDWLTTGKLVDAIAVGQITPGPVFSSATFIGYVVDGWTGALVATAGVFLPSFFLAALVAPAVTRARRSPWTAAALDGINASALGLMAGVGVDLARSALTGAVPVLIAVVGAVVIFRWRVNSAWVVMAGAIIGAVHALA